METMRKTDTKTLIEALHILARDIQSEDGVANACITEGAQRIAELDARVQYLEGFAEGLRRRVADLASVKPVAFV
jgi:hypothetical protein